MVVQASTTASKIVGKEVVIEDMKDVIGAGVAVGVAVGIKSPLKKAIGIFYIQAPELRHLQPG